MTRARDVANIDGILTTKGDIYAASAAYTPARLGAGSDGYTLVADSSTSTGLAYSPTFFAGKNACINGDFRINQRGFTSTTTNSTYGFDRFTLTRGTGGTVTYSAQTFTPGTAPVTGYEAINYARLVSASQSATSDRALLQQRIEDARTFANQTVTFSFWAKASTGTPNIAVEITQTFGTGGSPSSAVTGIGAQKFAITSSWVRYTKTITVPSVSGKTFGTDANSSFLTVGIWISAGSDYNSRTDSLGNQDITVDIWGVQLEAGSTATQFQTATGTIQGELAACQRYYVRETGQSAAANDLATGWCNSTTNAVAIYRMPVTMRVAPTCTLSAAGDFYFTWSAGTSTITGAQVDRSSPNSIYLRVVTTGLTTGQGGVIGLLTGTTKWLEMSSEL